MKKPVLILAVLAVVAIGLAVALFGGGLTETPDTPPKERKARLAPGDLSADQLDEVVGAPGADPAPSAAPPTSPTGEPVQPGIAAPTIAPASPDEPGVQPDPGLLSRFELIIGDMPEDQRPIDVVWTCPEAPHTCNVEGTLERNEYIANFMHALEDNPQAEDDEIPTVYLNHLNSLPEGGKRFQLNLELP